MIITKWDSWEKQALLLNSGNKKKNKGEEATKKKTPELLLINQDASR